MGGPSSYAQAIPKARILKATLLTPDKVKEMIATPDFKDAIAQLRDSLYTQASEASTIEEATRQLETAYMKILARLERASPPDGSEVVAAFRRDYELRDILTALQRVIVGSPGLYELPSYHVENSLLRRITQDPEALASHTRFIEALEATWAHRYLVLADKIYRDTRNPMLVSWAHLYGSLDMYTAQLSEHSHVDTLHRVICPIVEQRVAHSLIQAKVGGIDSKLVEQLIAPARRCGLDIMQLRQAYDREAIAEDLAASVRDLFKYVRLEGNTVGEILSSIRRTSRMALKTAVRIAFESYPFTPAIVAAASAMIRIEVEDVNAILTSISMRLKPDEYSNLLIIDK
ncbi:MAG: V-type ATPase subunit [Desulfurococcales archaeon]|nr:V-type ATPase subunit [Desulfurococcales archaeon]MCE4605058.1 V-type ATPase subunit [Desulfurococcales archaeon]